MAPILIVEDDFKIGAVLQDYIRAQEWTSILASDGQSALEIFASTKISMILLDLGLPGLDGIKICKQIRASSMVPVIMLTARISEDEKLLGFETGADDYICKPFSPREVIARLKIQARRSYGSHEQARPPSALSASTKLELDAKTQRLWQNEISLDLTLSEFRIMQALMKNPEQILSRAQLQDAMHLELRDTSDRTIDSHIRNLRRKISSTFPNAVNIKAVYGSGYRL